MQRSVRVLLSLTAVLLLAPAHSAGADGNGAHFSAGCTAGHARSEFLAHGGPGHAPGSNSGPLGVILNRPTNVQLRELYPDRKELTGRDDLVFFGGPVQPDALLFAFRSAAKPPKGLAVTGDIYISGFSEVLDELLKHPENANEQRFFAGYAGWAQGQLEFEIERGGWYTLPLDVDAIFKMNPLTIYEDLVKRATVRRIETKREIHIRTAAAAGRY